MDGLSLQRAVGNHVAIIILTGRPDVESAVGVLSAGEIDFLVKPVSDMSLLSAVGLERAVERFHERRELATLRSNLALLSTREREVMTVVVDGLRNKMVADRRGIVETTVKVHRQRVMKKLALDSLPALVRMVDRRKMVCQGVTD